MLVDPQFLFRFEREPAERARRDAVYRISDLELASRLSFFLWSSIPDDELLDRGGEGPAAAIRRCSSSRCGACWPTRAPTRSSTTSPASGCTCAQLDERAARCAGLRRATCASRSSARPSCSSETIVREDRSVLDLLDADYTFVNERLARHYGIPNVHGSRFRRVALRPTSPRRGLLGQGSVLTVTSAANRTSPVMRGKWILENLLGTPPPPPPPGVEPNLEKTPAQVQGRRRCGSGWSSTAPTRRARPATR